MKSEDFSQDAAGILIHGLSGYQVFQPNSLPPVIRWSQELASVLSEASAVIGQLRGVGQWLKNPHVLINPFIRREAVLSSRIEGTQATISDLYLFEASPKQNESEGDVREVHNYVTALNHGLAHIKTRPLTLNLIRQMHALLMEGVRGQERTPGEFRRTQNWIGPGQCKIEDATYVPPPPEKLSDLLDAFEKYLHAPSEIPILVKLALIHYQFESIHPFNDGNGRLGRLLITLLLCHDHLLDLPLLYLSAYLEKQRTEYYRHLLRVSQKGAWEEWIAFFLRGVKEQAKDAMDRSQRLLDLRDQYHLAVKRISKSVHMLDLVDLLFERPVIRISDVINRLHVTHRAARLNVEKLVTARIIKKISTGVKNQIFLADDILRIL